MTPLQNAAIGMLAAAISAHSAAEHKLSARELFYSPVAASAKPSPPPAKPAKNKPPRTADAGRRPGKPPVRGEPRPPEAELATVSHAPSSLALRYSVLKLAGGGRFEEVDPDSTFRSGDRIRITLQVNNPGYLYVVHQGSSGVWKFLFPSKDVASGSNRVKPGEIYEIPPGGRFYFDEQAGVERLFLVVARQPVDDLDSLIYTVRPGAAPRTEPGRQPESPVMLAQNIQPVADGLIGRIRTEVLARDLVFEKVDEHSPGERREKAVYAAAVESGGGARVVADIQLRHQ